MNTDELEFRCQLMCGAEAKALGLSHEIGEYVYLVCTRENVNSWSNQDMRNWVSKTKAQYPECNRTDIIRLYIAAVSLIADYKNYVKSIPKKV